MGKLPAFSMLPMTAFLAVDFLLENIPLKNTFCCLLINDHFLLELFCKDSVSGAFVTSQPLFSTSLGALISLPVLR